MSSRLDRRGFLGYGLAAVSTQALPLDRVRPLDRVVVGVMGVNARGHALAADLARLEGVDVGYLCDVDRRALDKATRTVAGAQERAPTAVADFRRLLDARDLDALVVAAPDHWHAPAAILACTAGKDVYVEKPCCHNAAEGELLVAAARKHGRVVQMGNQRRSWPAVIDAITAAKTRIGRPYLGRAWYANARPETGKRTPRAVPDWLDWELWQGPAPRRPFTANVVHYKWHWFHDWGTGEMGNNAVHAVDLCRWALGVDYPTRVVSSGGRLHFDDDQQFPDTHLVAWEFGDDKRITFEGVSCNGSGLDGSGFGASVLGTEGSVTIGASEWVLRDRRGKEMERHPIEGGNTTHLADFLASIKDRTPPNSEIAGGHQSTLLTHLGNIAHRTGSALRCDPRNGHILDDPRAARLWGREYAEGWEPRV